MQLKDFQLVVWGYYLDHGRHDLTWRQTEPDGTYDAYKIMVSEIMLQQTQVTRVIPKYAAFLVQFPSVQALASAPLAQVIQAWSGLGYNRRAKFLWQAAGIIEADFDGVLPRDLASLVRLPGIGINTAGAIMAYAYDQPVSYIETNIRTVYIHHFFGDAECVSDHDLGLIIDESMAVIRKAGDDELSPRTWYWALMDYGYHLKQTAGNASRRSASYARQSTFKGSRRQIRGAVLRYLQTAPLLVAELEESVKDDRLYAVLEDLMREKMISRVGEHYQLGDIMIQF